MAQPVTAILSRQEALCARAHRFTHDVNEANLLVGKVVSRALTAFEGDVADADVHAAMQRDLDRMIERLRRMRR